MGYRAGWTSWATGSARRPPLGITPSPWDINQGRLQPFGPKVRVRVRMRVRARVRVRVRIMRVRVRVLDRIRV